MMPIGWFSTIAFNIVTWRCRSLTSDSTLLAKTDLRAMRIHLRGRPSKATVSIKHAVSEALATDQNYISKSRAGPNGRIRPPGHVAIARFSRTARPDRDEADGNRLAEPCEAGAARECSTFRRQTIVHEFGQHDAQDLFPDAGGGDGTVRPCVEACPHDRGIADATGHHERDAARRAPRRVSPLRVARDRADRVRRVGQ